MIILRLQIAFLMTYTPPAVTLLERTFPDSSLPYVKATVKIQVRNVLPTPLTHSIYILYEIEKENQGAVNQPNQPAQLASPTLKTSDPADPVPQKPEHLSVGLVGRMSGLVDYSRKTTSCSYKDSLAGTKR